MASEEKEVSQSSFNLLFDDKDMLVCDDNAFHEHYTVRQMSLRKDKLFTDVLVKSRHLAIPCHKVALSSASEFLYRKLTSGEVNDILELNKISPDILEVVIDYIYTAKIEVKANLVKDLVVACVELEIHSLKDVCDKFIAERINVKNAMGIVTFAKNSDLKMSFKKAMEVLVEQPGDILRLALDVEYQNIDEKIFLEWLAREDLRVSDESVVFHLAENWIKAKSSRKNEESARRVLSKVRLPICSVKVLAEASRSPFMEFRSCQILIDHAKNIVMLKNIGEDTAGWEGDDVKPRGFVSSVFLLGGGTTDKTPNTQFWCLREGEKVWKELALYPEADQKYTHSMGCCVVGEDIIITGGGSRPEGVFGRSNSAWSFNVVKQIWSKLPDMIDARSLHGTVVLERKVLVIGGWDGKALSSVELLNETQSNWEKKMEIPKPLDWCFSFYVSGKVYVTSRLYCDCFQYDVSMDTWQTKEKMPSKSYASTMIGFKEHIYALGGKAGSQCYRYDTNLDTWSTISFPNIIHIHGSAVLMNNKILLCGGWTDNDCTSATDDVEEYDIENDTWSKHSVQLPKKLGGHNMISAVMPIM